MSDNQAQHAEYVAVPFEARHSMQKALYALLLGSDNEWTTWSDSIALAETAAKALSEAGWQVTRIDGDIPSMWDTPLGRIIADADARIDGRADAQD
jgi:hypothetical protein